MNPMFEGKIILHSLSHATDTLGAEETAGVATGARGAVVEHDAQLLGWLP